MAGVAKVTFNGETWIDVTDKTVTSNKMLTTGTALSRSGDDITGSITSNSSSDVTASGKTVTVPAGYYSSSVSKSVATGSAGTPTAAKGSVTVVDGYRSMSVTPSVTNTTGYITGGTKTGTAVTVSASELVSGNKAITSNGTGIDVANYSTVSVAVPTSAVNNQDKTVAPSTEQQAITADSGYTGLGTVTVNAMPTMTLPSGAIQTSTGTQKGTINRSIVDRYLNIPTGYNGTAQYYKISAIPDGTPGTPIATKETASDGSITITPSVTNRAGYIGGGTLTGTAVTVTASELVNNQNKTITPTESQQSVTADTGYTGLGTVTVNAIPDEYVVPSGDKTITSSGTTDVAGYATASVSQATIPTDTSTTVPLGIINATINANTSDQYLTIPKGYNDARFNYKISKIASGAVSSPVATKGAVSNNSITITPSVTTTTGYITGSTKNGTPVTVNASELVSGTKSITSNGTGIDVTNFASVDVSVGSTILNQNKTVTPTTSQQTVTADSGYTGLGTVTVESMPVGSRGTPLVTRIKTPLLNPTQLTVRINDSSTTGLTPGYFDSFVDQVNFTLEDKTVTPSASTQTITPTSTDYYLDKVTVNPIPSQYIIPTGNIDITSSGTTTVTNYDTATVSAMTLPTAPTTTYTGTKVGSNIGRSTSTRYLNIPAGYNDTAKYYQISAVSNMTLPTATSTSATGTSKLTITPDASTKYLNIPTGYNGTASYYTISPGMTFETGTWTPSEDIARGTISFASTHSSMPLYVCIFDQTQTTHATGSPSYMLYMDEYQIFGATFPSNTNFRYGCITSLFKTDSGTNVYAGTLQYPSTETGNSSTAYPRYWVTESGFYPYSGSTARYWRAGRTYKWLAVWKAQ